MNKQRMGLWDYLDKNGGDLGFWLIMGAFWFAVGLGSAKCGVGTNGCQFQFNTEINPSTDAGAQ